MMRRFGLCVVAVVGTLAIASFASGTPTQASAVTKFKAALTVGQVVSPRAKGTKAGATGSFNATLTGTKLKWTLTYSHLSGRAIAAHIHMGVRGKVGIALISLCGPCRSPLSGTANSVTDDVAALMEQSHAYVNVHTAKNAEGEIRGQVTLVH